MKYFLFIILINMMLCNETLAYKLKYNNIIAGRAVLNESILNNVVKDIKDFLDQIGNIKPNATKTLEYLNLQLENLSNEIMNKLDINYPKSIYGSRF